MGTQAQFNGVSLLQGSADITLQIGASDGNQLIMQTRSGQTTGTGFKIDFASSGTGSTAYGTLGEGVSFSLSQFTVGSTNVATRSGTTATSASANALLSLDSMINNVSRMRSQVGAYENSLGSNMDYLDRYVESLRGARSRVQDVDVAAESADTSRAQILQQSAATMLSQANATPQIALNLLP
jgi:flagellin